MKIKFHYLTTFKLARGQFSYDPRTKIIIPHLRDACPPECSVENDSTGIVHVVWGPWDKRSRLYMRNASSVGRFV